MYLGHYRVALDRQWEASQGLREATHGSQCTSIYVSEFPEGFKSSVRVLKNQPWASYTLST